MTTTEKDLTSMGWREAVRYLRDTLVPDPFEIPYYGRGELGFAIVCHQILTIGVSGAGGTSTRVTPHDFLRTIVGGLVSPQLQYDIRKDGGEWQGLNGNNHAVYLTFDETEIGTVVLYVKVTDGESTDIAQCAVVVFDSDGMS